MKTNELTKILKFTEFEKMLSERLLVVGDVVESKIDGIKRIVAAVENDVIKTTHCNSMGEPIDETLSRKDLIFIRH
jgi:hypothetical protein